MNKVKDITGKRYNSLVATDNYIKGSAETKVVWEFLCDCGNKKYINKSSVVRGSIKSCGCSKSLPLELGTVIESKKDGRYKVIEKLPKSRYKIKFIDTGYETTAQSPKVRCGDIRDHYKPFKFGVGYLGEMAGKTRSGINPNKSYQVWHNMLLRCYYEKDRHKNKAYANVSVCEEWFNYSNFHKWFEENYIEGMQLDKDMLSKESKIYSPQTCCFLSAYDNSDIKPKTSWLVRSPEGDEIVVDNVGRFCSNLGVSAGTFALMLHGKRNIAWGWTVIKKL